VWIKRTVLLQSFSLVIFGLFGLWHCFVSFG
jgi:hypothetical protein